MCTKEEFEVKFEYDDSNLSYYDEYKDNSNNNSNGDVSMTNDGNGEWVTIKGPSGEDVSLFLRLGNRLLFASGRYFTIEGINASTEHQKECTGVTGACVTCGAKIKGSLKVSSNFICHLKGKHPEKYEEFVRKKSESSSGQRGPRIKAQRMSPYPKTQNAGSVLQQNQNQDQFQRNILHYLIDTNQSLSLVANSSFIKMFEFNEFPLQVRTPEYYEKMLIESCEYKKSLFANYHTNNKLRVCITVDQWSCGPYRYIAIACHWIDNDYQRQSSLISCSRRRTEDNSSTLSILMENLMKFGCKMENIIVTLAFNMKNYSNDFINYGLTKECITLGSMESSDEKALLHEIKNTLEMPAFVNNNIANSKSLEILKLIHIWSTMFYKMLNDELQSLHKLALEKCSQIWSNCRSKKFMDNFSTLWGPTSLSKPHMVSFVSLFTSIKQLLTHKDQLVHVCRVFNIIPFTLTELEYLEELVDVNEPMVAAFDFLDMPQNNFYGCFLPTLVTLKIKLTKLINSKNLKHLNNTLVGLKENLLIEFSSYYELNDSVADSILAAITYPPVKTRFLMGLQDSPSYYNFQPRNFLLKYGKDFFTNMGNQVDIKLSSSTTVNSNVGLDFFDFGDVTDTATEDSHFPAGLKQEIDNYLADTDYTLSSLYRYPTIKSMFYNFNTRIPSAAPISRLFPIQNILKNSNSVSNDLFENYIFYKYSYMK